MEFLLFFRNKIKRIIGTELNCRHIAKLGTYRASIESVELIDFIVYLFS